jgi:sugar lactone lactonase YvrE
MNSAKPLSLTIAEMTPEDGGVVVTPDNKTLIVSGSSADGSPRSTSSANGSQSNRASVGRRASCPDRICLDAEGAVWAQSANTSAVR